MSIDIQTDEELFALIDESFDAFYAEAMEDADPKAYLHIGALRDMFRSCYMAGFADGGRYTLRATGTYSPPAFDDYGGALDPTKGGTICSKCGSGLVKGEHIADYPCSRNV